MNTTIVSSTVLSFVSGRYRPPVSQQRKEPKWWKYARKNKLREDEMKKENKFHERFEEYITSIRDW